MRGGKPNGMHNKTYVGLLGKLKILRTSLYGKSRRYASDKYSEFVKCNWRLPMPRDDLFFPGAALSLHLAKAGMAENDSSTPTSLGPVVFNDGARRDFRDGYETSDPDDL